jgi:LEA14-like dessication related protein
MKNIFIKPFTFAFALLVLLTSSMCKDTIKEPTFIKIQDTKVSNFSLANANAKLSSSLLFHNPNNFGLQAKDANLKVYVENQYVGDAVQASAVNVKANSDFAFPIIADFDLKNTLSSMMSLLGKSELKYKIEGTIRVGKAEMFVKVPVKVEDVYKIN